VHSDNTQLILELQRIIYSSESLHLCLQFSSQEATFKIKIISIIKGEILNFEHFHKDII
jgi:hypothetical protein